MNNSRSPKSYRALCTFDDVNDDVGISSSGARVFDRRRSSASSSNVSFCAGCLGTAMSPLPRVLCALASRSERGRLDATTRRRLLTAADARGRRRTESSGLLADVDRQREGVDRVVVEAARRVIAEVPATRDVGLEYFELRAQRVDLGRCQRLRLDGRDEVLDKLSLSRRRELYRLDGDAVGFEVGDGLVVTRGVDGDDAGVALGDVTHNAVDLRPRLALIAVELNDTPVRVERDGDAIVLVSGKVDAGRERAGRVSRRHRQLVRARKQTLVELLEDAARLVDELREVLLSKDALGQLTLRLGDVGLIDKRVLRRGLAERLIRRPVIRLSALKELEEPAAPLRRRDCDHARRLAVRQRRPQRVLVRVLIDFGGLVSDEQVDALAA